MAALAGLPGLLALIVLAACGWSVLLLTRHQGGSWPVVAVVAGVLSLLMIGLDVRARRRQRAQLRRRAVPRRGRAAVRAVVPAPALAPPVRRRSRSDSAARPALAPGLSVSG